MKKIILSLITISFAGLLVSAVAQDAPGGNPGDTNAPAAPEPATPPGTDNGPDNGGTPQPAIGGEQPAMPGQPATDTGTDNGTLDNNTNAGPMLIEAATRKTAPSEEITSNFMPPELATGTNQNDLNLNFRNAPLEMVLNYLSDAAGFIIVQEVRVNGSVTIKGNHLTKDEVVDLLNAELNKNNYAAVRKDRTLTIVDKNDAKTSRIPVRSGYNPDEIPDNAEIVTQIIPIRFVEARQLVSDLTSFVSSQATVVANEAGNSVVITDTQSNIRHLMKIIKAIDDSAEAETEIQVFKLQYANPADVASELASVFPSSSSGNSAQAPTRFGGGQGGGGPGGFFARMMGGGGGTTSGGSNDRVKKATQVTAVADARIQAVIVTAPKDLMTEIAGMMKELDVRSDRDQDVAVIPLKNGDPQQVVQLLQTMFQSSGSTRSSGSSSSQNSLLMQRSQNATTTMGTTTSTSGIGSSGTSGGGGGGRASQF